MGTIRRFFPRNIKSRKTFPVSFYPKAKGRSVSYLSKVKRSIDYIEANLREKLDLVRVAKVIAFSPYHFHYVFSVTVGETFKGYIRKRRLTEAAHELRGTKQRILDVAVSFGFESQEAFTRAFKKMFRMTPGAYRKAYQIPRYYEKKQLSLKDLEHRVKGIKLRQKSVKLAEFYVIGLEYLGSHDHKGQIGKLWDQLAKRRDEITNTTDPREEYGYCYATPAMVQKDQMRYIAGIKAKSLKLIPKGMVGVKIPSQSYAVFTHKGAVDKIGASYDYIYGAWFPKSGMEPADGPDFEKYDERFKYGADSSELDLYVPVVASGR